MIAETTCLITDVQMPGLSGLELQEALKSQGYQTPVILITAYPNEKHRTRALGNGAVGFLSKPFDEDPDQMPDRCDHDPCARSKGINHARNASDQIATRIACQSCSAAVLIFRRSI